VPICTQKLESPTPRANGLHLVRGIEIRMKGIEHVNSTTPAMRLEVLHLEHIDIPTDAIFTTIDANNLEEWWNFDLLAPRSNPRCAKILRNPSFEC